MISSLVYTIRELFEWNPSLQVLISAAVRDQKTLDAFISGCGW